MVGWQGCKVEGMLGQGRRTKVWAWQQVNEKFASIFVVRGVQMYFASFVLARPRISFPISPTPNIQPPMHTHTHTHKHIHTQKTPAFAYGHSFRSDFCFTLPIWKLWLYFTPSHMHTHAHSETFCLAATSIVVFCGHVNALPRPPPTAHQRPVTPPHCCCYCEAFFLISTLHAAHCFAFVSFSLFSRRTESALNFYLILSQLRCGCLTWLHCTSLHFTSLHRRLKPSARQCVIFYGVNLTMIGFSTAERKSNLYCYVSCFLLLRQMKYSSYLRWLRSSKWRKN